MTVKLRLKSLPLGVTLREGLLAVAGALLAAASFPPLGLWPLALVSAALFLVLIRDRPAASARPLGLLYGLVYGLGTMYWFAGIFGPVAVGLVALFALYFGLLATLIALTRGHRPAVRALLAALFAVAVEWLRGDAWYLRFPWYTVPHALAAAPAWIAAARWLGTYGLSFLIWFVAGLGAFARPYYWLALLLLPASSLLLPTPAPPDHHALLLQAEEDPGVEAVIHNVPAEKVDLAVLPEYAYYASPGMALRSKHGPRALARKTSSPVVFGAVEGNDSDRDYRNIAAVIDAGGQLIGTFTKQRPLPLFRDGIPGTTRPVFPLEQGTLGVAICYDFDAPEVAAALVRQGATVLVVPTFDARSWGTTEHVQHELLVRLRAVENDRWVLRAVSSGRSEAIDPRGYPSQDGLDIGSVGYVTVPFAHRGSRPPGTYASGLGPAAAALTAAVFIVGLARMLIRKRRVILPVLRESP
ncbi:MAG TPA: nitrilase-related carbon-nitrogen hydrolase [Gemmataceae bacterium]|nr:nitrilase-related carbon-nitrogen hydrolase [Gemmataceae bacterium]